MKSRISSLIFGLLLCASAPAFADLFGGTNPPSSTSGSFSGTVTFSSNVVDGSGSQGTTGQSLQSNGGSAPTWVNVPSAILSTTSSWTAAQTLSSATATNLNVGVLKSTQNITLTNSCGYIIGTIVQSSQTTSAASITTSGTGYNLTPTSGTITMKCISDQIVITVAGSVQATITTGHSTSISIFRGVTDLSGGPSFLTISGTITGVEYAAVPLSYIESPASLSPLSYDVELKSTTAAEGIWNPNVDIMTMRLDEVAR